MSLKRMDNMTRKRDPYTDKAPWMPDPPDRPRAKPSVWCWGCAKRERVEDRYCGPCWEEREETVLKFRAKAEALRDDLRS